MLYEDWGAFPEPWRIEVTESTLEQHLRSLLKPDGTVHGLSDPDEPVETDAMMAAYNLFTIDLDEVARPGGASEPIRDALIVGAGLHPRQ